MRYDPDVSPEPTEWLALDEGEQIELVEDYHRRAKVDLPNLTLHAAIHSVVERQLAEQLPAAVNAMRRLLAEGLERHDAVHAIGSVLGEHMRQLITGALDATNPNATYFSALDRLSASSWRREFGTDDDEQPES